MKFNTDFGITDVIRMVVFFFGILIFSYLPIQGFEQYRSHLHTEKGLVSLFIGTVLYNLLMHIQL